MIYKRRRIGFRALTDAGAARSRPQELKTDYPLGQGRASV